MATRNAARTRARVMPIFNSRAPLSNSRQARASTSPGAGSICGSAASLAPIHHSSKNASNETADRPGTMAKDRSLARGEVASLRAWSSAIVPSGSWCGPSSIGRVPEHTVGQRVQSVGDTRAAGLPHDLEQLFRVALLCLQGHLRDAIDKAVPQAGRQSVIGGAQQRLQLLPLGVAGLHDLL